MTKVKMKNLALLLLAGTITTSIGFSANAQSYEQLKKQRLDEMNSLVDKVNNSSKRTRATSESRRLNAASENFSKAIAADMEKERKEREKEREEAKAQAEKDGVPYIEKKLPPRPTGNTATHWKDQIDPDLYKVPADYRSPVLRSRPAQ